MLLVLQGVLLVSFIFSDKVRCLEDLYCCVFNVLVTCNRECYKLVGMPAISSGRYKVFRKETLCLMTGRISGIAWWS